MKNTVITAAIFIAAVGLIAYGIYTKEAAEVFRKAVNICLECIGVG
ncbi:MAG: CD1871A family CXXC motif-containing protein [Christensenellales bacterium]|jgi:hypothetical protein